MDYQSRTTVELKLPFGSNDEGCSDPGIRPEEDRKYPIALLVRKGGCSYINKARYASRAGSRMVFVILTDPDESPNNVIPISPKDQSDIVPPVVVISKDVGEKLIDTLNKGNQVFLSVDFDMVIKNFKNKQKKYSAPLDVKIWIQLLDKNSLDFYIDFLEFYEHYQSVAKIETVFFLKDADYYNYFTEEAVNRFCYHERDYCVGKIASKVNNKN